MVIGCDNIWANVGPDDSPIKLNWNLDAHGAFKFGGAWAPLFAQADDVEIVRSNIDQLCVQPDTLNVNPRPTEAYVVVSLKSKRLVSRSSARRAPYARRRTKRCPNSTHASMTLSSRHGDVS